jgi:pyruvate-formate lyase-activating enzyme
MRDAYAILKIPEPEILKEGVKLAMTDIKQMLDDYLAMKRSRGARYVLRRITIYARAHTWLWHCAHI